MVEGEREEARKEGLKEGEQLGLSKGEKLGIQKGLKEGRKKGLAEGEAHGIMKGERKKARETAKAFKKMGLPISQIAKGTGLTKEEIEKL